MSARIRLTSRTRTASVNIALLLGAACSPAPAPIDLPVPTPPSGWTSLGSVQADASDRLTVGLYTFSGRGAAVQGSCRGDGTLFVIVGWNDVSSTTGPARFETAAFPCLAPSDEPNPSRIELTTALSGAYEVGAFVIEGHSAIERPIYAVSVEERDP